MKEIPNKIFAEGAARQQIMASCFFSQLLPLETLSSCMHYHMQNKHDYLFFGCSDHSMNTDFRALPSALAKNVSMSMDLVLTPK